MDKLVQNFLLKLAQKSCCFYTFLAAKSCFANIDRPVTFCYMTFNAIFLNNVVIQLILELTFSENIIKYILKILNFFLGHAVNL